VGPFARDVREATLKDGGIEQTNFDSYHPVADCSQMPEVAVNVIANGDEGDRPSASPQ